MACQIKRDNNGNIAEVLAPNNKPSILYNSLVDSMSNSIFKQNVLNDEYVSSILDTEYIKDTSNEEIALAAWSKAYTANFIDTFGDWKDSKLSNTDINGEPLVSTLFQTSSNILEVKPGVAELFEDNPELAAQVYETLGFKSKPDVILPIGTSGSGKSTFIKSLPQENLVVIEPDAMRVEFTGNMNDKSKDKEIYIEAANRATQAIKQGKQVVFDTTNLTKDKRLPFIEAIKKAIPNANIQYKLMELNPELAKQRIKAQLERGENRAAVSDETIDRHAASYKQMLEDIKSEPISNFELTPQQKQQAQEQYSQYLDTVFPESKVKDIVYHGSPNTKIESFLSPEKEGYKKQETTTTGVAGIYFTNKKYIADIYQDFKQHGIKGKTYSVVINVKRPLIVGNKATDGISEGTLGADALWNIQRGVINPLKKAGIDAIQSGEYASKVFPMGENVETAVFEPEQIHILGSKQDIQQFKEYVKAKSKIKTEDNNWTQTKNNCSKLI